MTRPARWARRPRLKALAIHRYYWPDTPPYASMLRDIVAQWSADGIEVDVVSSQPSYKRHAEVAARPRREQVDDAVVRRVSLRSEHAHRWRIPVNTVHFSTVVAIRILITRRRYDVVMTSTAPPVVLAWIASMAVRLRGGKFIYHCMDIHPEIGRISGEFSNAAVFRLLRRLDQSTCTRASAVVVLSTDMAESLRRRDPSRSLPLHVINNFELGQRANVPTSDLGGAAGDRIRLVFTGNIGRFQGLDSVIAALAMVSRADVQFTLMGDGSAVEDLRALAERAGVDAVFLPHQDVASARALIASADLGLVSLTGGIHRFAYPSKTMTYLAEGCPVLAVIESDCELVAMLDREGLGLSVAPGDPAALAAALDRLAARPGALAAMRATARARGSAVFDKDATLKLWSRLVRDVAGQGQVA